MNGITRIGVAAAGSLILASVAMAQGAPAGGAPAQTPEQKAEATVLTRQGLFKVQSFAFGPVGAMLRPGGTFDAAVATKAAQRVQVTASMIPEVFATDTHTFGTIKTRAREGIWSNKSDFDSKANDLVKAAADLEAAAKAGDKDKTLAAARAVGKGCSGCHDQFRDNP
jgi:cytochrome c556